jgi:hypothetical protein
MNWCEKDFTKQSSSPSQAKPSNLLRRKLFCWCRFQVDPNDKTCNMQWIG